MRIILTMVSLLLLISCDSMYHFNILVYVPNELHFRILFFSDKNEHNTIFDNYEIEKIQNKIYTGTSFIFNKDFIGTNGFSSINLEKEFKRNNYKIKILNTENKVIYDNPKIEIFNKWEGNILIIINYDNIPK